MIERTRPGWRVESGTPEEMELRKVERWRAMTPDERVEALVQMLEAIHGERRMVRTYRVVDLSQPRQ